MLMPKIEGLEQNQIRVAKHIAESKQIDFTSGYAPKRSYVVNHRLEVTVPQGYRIDKVVFVKINETSINPGTYESEIPKELRNIIEGIKSLGLDKENEAYAIAEAMVDYHSSGKRS